MTGLATPLAEAAAVLEREPAFNVLLLDVKLGEDSGLDLLSRVRSSSTVVIVLTAHDYGPYLAAAHRLGAAGFVVKTALLGTLVDAIRRDAAGGIATDDQPKSLP